MSLQKQVYFFGKDQTEGDAKSRDLLGGKGANLAEMTRIGIPVPPGFTITTQACLAYFESNETLHEALKEEVLLNLNQVESILNQKFGDPSAPLLLSVRSGARVSMPGMMDTILNLGLNDNVVEGLIELTQDPRFAYDAYRRFVQMYGEVVLEVPSQSFSSALKKLKEEVGVKLDTELKSEHWKNLVQVFKKIILDASSQKFPEDPQEQLWLAIKAVFRSWNSKRAIEYRRIERIPHDWGTAVNVQSMVFGNQGEDSATGVAFSRHPATGENIFFGEYLINAQGEDVVAGIRTPMPINKFSAKNQALVGKSLEVTMPRAYGELEQIYKKLEKHYRDMQDIEFTIQKGQVWVLQTRNGKRTATAALKIACDFVKEGLLKPKEAILKVTPDHLDQLLHPYFEEQAKAEAKLLTKGLPASPGAAIGKIYFSPEEVVRRVNEGETCLLVREETSPEDIAGMHKSAGILTIRGGMTSHAAVVARGMGRTCIVGCRHLRLHEEDGKTFMNLKTKEGEQITLNEGDLLSLDGGTGEVFLGEVPVHPSELSENFKTIMKYCDESKKLKIRANADRTEDAKKARELGAEGIGLCRTEHMFFEKTRIHQFRQLILSHSPEARENALVQIAVLQKNDFIEILREMKGLPVTIRLLDPPLHEFLPRQDEAETEIKSLAKALGISEAKVHVRINALAETNPMLGHRGSRLGITFPDIYETQVKAILEAAVFLKEKEGIEVVPEIMLPLISDAKELQSLRARVERVSEEIILHHQVQLDYKIGTMIEIPRAAICADELALHADFFSFGTNDLTQLTFGISRDDANRFMPEYLAHQILLKDPFASLDETGVGALIKLAVEKGRKQNQKIHLGLCGEHGGDASSIFFCHQLGLDYVSCSPFRVPLARLAAAQAAVRSN